MENNNFSCKKKNNSYEKIFMIPEKSATCMRVVSFMNNLINIFYIIETIIDSLSFVINIKYACNY